MKIKWEVDDHTVVDAVINKFGTFGRKTIAVNGVEVVRRRSWGMKLSAPFSIPGDRDGLLVIRPRFVGRPEFELIVDGQFVAETGKKPVRCAACNAIAKSYDRFCPECGRAMPSVLARQQDRDMGRATTTITVLACMYVVFGLVMYNLTQGQVDTVMTRLAGMAPDDLLDPIDGVTYTVGQFKDKLAWEPKGVLLVNGILAAVMALLALWSRRAPLPAVIAALATFAVVNVGNVGNAMMDPRTLAQGWLLKLIVVIFLVRGIKSALALRHAST